MTHPLVTQLYFARSEFVRCLDGLSAEDAIVRIQPMNCISWIIGHLAWHEQYLWVGAAQNRSVVDGLHKLVGYGQPASTPPLEEMWAAWRAITAAGDDFLDTIDNDQIETHLEWEGEPLRESIGKSLLRNTYHYWFHIGEAHAIRQSLGHGALPDFVGNMDDVKFVIDD